MTNKDLRYIKISRVNPLYIIKKKKFGSLKKAMEKKYLGLFPTNQSKQILKKTEEMWNKIRILIRSITSNSGYYNEKKI